jgi:hypothetical protein
MSLPKDKCPFCGHEREFSMYAAAHWHITLDTTCDNEECKRQYSVRMGRAIVLKKARKKT